MEPIERELADRKERLKRMAIELQQLEAIRPRRPIGHPGGQEEHDRTIVQLQYKIDVSQAGVRELEEIIAEGRSPLPIAKPDTSRRRILSPEERQAIEDQARADLEASMPRSAHADIHIHVGRITDLNGKPQVSIHITPRG